MSDSWFTVVQLASLDLEERERRAQDVATWLLGLGVIVVRPPGQSEDGFGDWYAGPEWRYAAALPAPYEGEEVDISVERLVYSAMSNFENPTCRECGWELSDSSELYASLIDRWWRDDVEPAAICESCGWSELFGEWPTLYPPGLVSGLVVQFRRWPSLRDDFVEELELRLGPGRCKHFWAHL